MGIMDAIKSLFGKGQLKFRVTFADGSVAISKTKYVGDISTLDLEYIKDIQRQIEFDTNRKVANVVLIDHIEN